MGHVPSGPISFHRQGPHLSRREHRGSRPTGSHPLERRPRLAEFGESIASWFLTDQGLRVRARNVRVDRGEIDIVAMDGSRMVAVEVRTVTESAYPLDAIGEAKRAQVRRLADTIGARRCDAVGIGVFEDSFVVHWCPDLF